MTYSEIIFEDNHLIAVNKIGGALVQADRTNDTILSDDIKIYIKNKYNKPGDVYLATVHRIDRPVSGLVLFAKTSKAGARISKAFRENEIKKTYLAIVKQKPKELKSQLILYLSKDDQKNKSFVVDQNHPNGKLAILDYEWLGNIDNLHLIKIHPVTGRHHQIRAMLSHIGIPIKGDLKYGSFPANNDGNISLHAYSIEFLHPVRKEKLILNAKLPPNKDWEKFSDILS